MKLSGILTELEKGYISADHAEANIMSIMQDILDKCRDISDSEENSMTISNRISEINLNQYIS